MNKREAIERALEYVQSIDLEVGPVVEVRYVDLGYLDEKAKDCPSEWLDTYNSVRKSFRNQWVVSFRRKEVSSRVSCPETHMVCVFETGEVTLFSSP